MCANEENDSISSVQGQRNIYVCHKKFWRISRSDLCKDKSSRPSISFSLGQFNACGLIELFHYEGKNGERERKRGRGEKWRANGEKRPKPTCTHLPVSQSLHLHFADYQHVTRLHPTFPSVCLRHFLSPSRLCVCMCVCMCVCGTQSICFSSRCHFDILLLVSLSLRLFLLAFVCFLLKHDLQIVFLKKLFEVLSMYVVPWSIRDTMSFSFFFFCFSKDFFCVFVFVCVCVLCDVCCLL